MFRKTSIASVRQFSSTVRANSFARTQILGRIGQDIVETESASGNKYVRYAVAVQTKKDAPVNWFNIISFNENQNNFLTSYVRKGALVHVEANLRQDVYEKEDGTKVTNYNLIQNRIELIQNPREVEEEESA